MPHIYVTSIHESQSSLHFALRWAIFKMQAILRQVHQMTSNWPWTLQGQITLYMYNNYPRVSHFTPFHSTTNRFRVTCHIETSAPNNPEWPWTLQGQRYTTYMLLVSPSQKFHSVLLYDQPFSRCRLFYNSPLTTMLNVPKKNDCQKSKIWNFTILYTTLVDTLPGSMHEFLGANLLCTFRKDVVWSFFFLPYHTYHPC